MHTNKTILTGMQPTGKLHLGSILGATNNWNKMMESNNCLFFLADQHAISIHQNPTELRNNTLDCIAQYISCGLDPNRCKIFVQSQIIGHTELAWVLGCLTPLGQLERMTQFKDKSQRQESIYTGLLYYPVLMAADILLYNADLVPTGEDQKQHMELTRDIAEKFNHTYSETFKIPESYILKEGSRVMSLQDPSKKMSKSDSNQNGTIFINDEPAVIKKKIISAVTDSDNKIYVSNEKPGITNLLNIYSAANGCSIEQSQDKFSSHVGYATFKANVADSVIELLEPIQKKYNEIKNDKDYLNSVVQVGADYAQSIAYKTMSKVYEEVGFLGKTQ
ncbi:MAG: tryptophan--tRNA ligase [Puniceicoccales bacterium]|jgi:tryptophanyl-tRNA synthetase|nr:tryptophan--tRNA ligase [Puniceicoccales bacterium]